MGPDRRESCGPVEDLVTVPINEEDDSRFFLVGSSMVEAEREILINFLKTNVDIFAWTPYEMPASTSPSSATV